MTNDEAEAPRPAGLQIVDLEVEGTLHGSLPPHLAYLGPTIRGALGHHLMRVACLRDGRCDSCDLAESCSYARIFDGRPSAKRAVMTRYKQVLQPFVLRVPPPTTDRRPGRPLRFSIRLFGDASQWIPDLCETIERIGGTGLGTERVRFDTTSIRHRIVLRDGDQQAEALDPPPSDGPIRWTFETPLHLSARIDRGEQPLDGLGLVLAGRRRWHLLTSLHGHAGAESTERLEAEAFRVVEEDLETFAIRRFSGRQKRSIPLRGVTGSLVVDGPWSQAGSWMRAARLIHLGKYGSFGFGDVRWSPA